MRAGAAVDVLITASKGTMDDAEAAELVDADTREDMFVNDLVIIRAEGSNTKVEVIADVANLDGKIAIGDAKTVPAGKYANQALASVGLYTGTEGDDGEYAPRSPTRSRWPTKGTAAAYVSQATAWPVLSTAPISSATTASRRPSCAPRIRTSPSCTRVPLPSSEHADEAKAFIDFCLTNKKAQKIWAKYGFELSA
ncbi:MAG: molybdate ABC transporter substrate-binding protein [Collinsella sp.]